MDMNDETLTELREAVLPPPAGAPPAAATLLRKARRRRYGRRVSGVVTAAACVLCVGAFAVAQMRTHQRAEAERSIAALHGQIDGLAQELAALRAEIDALQVSAETQAAVPSLTRPPLTGAAGNRLTVPYWREDHPNSKTRSWTAPDETAAILLEAVRHREARGLDTTGRYEEIISRFPDTPSAKRARKLAAAPANSAT